MGTTHPRPYYSRQSSLPIPPPITSLSQDLEGCIRRFNIPHEAIGERKISDMDSEYIRRLKLALAGANYPNYFIKVRFTFLLTYSLFKQINVLVLSRKKY